MARFIVRRRGGQRHIVDRDGHLIGRIRVGGSRFWATNQYHPVDIDTPHGIYHLHDFRAEPTVDPKRAEWVGDITDRSGVVVAQIITKQDWPTGRARADVAMAVTLLGRRLAFAKGRYIYRKLIDPAWPDVPWAVLRLTGKHPRLLTTGTEVLLSHHLTTNADPGLAVAVVLFLHNPATRGVVPPG